MYKLVSFWFSHIQDSSSRIFFLFWNFDFEFLIVVLLSQELCVDHFSKSTRKIQINARIIKKKEETIANERYSCQSNKLK